MASSFKRHFLTKDNIWLSLNRIEKILHRVEIRLILSSFLLNLFKSHFSNFQVKSLLKMPVKSTIMSQHGPVSNILISLGCFWPQLTSIDLNWPQAQLRASKCYKRPERIFLKVLMDVKLSTLRNPFPVAPRNIK